eukprot:709052-Hanusia_phi.AAC.4
MLTAKFARGVSLSYHTSEGDRERTLRYDRNNVTGNYERSLHRSRDRPELREDGDSPVATGYLVASERQDEIRTGSQHGPLDELEIEIKASND